MFEEALIESSGKRVSKTALTLPFSVAFHGMAIGVLVGASVWFVEDVPEPPIPITFYEVSDPRVAVPPVAPRGTPRTSEVRKAQPVRPTEMIQPISISDKIPVAPAALEPAISGEGEEGVEGRTGEVPGGVGDDGTGKAGGSEKPVHVGDVGVEAPVLRIKVDPAYPEAARRARLEGVVILEAIITASGAVEEAKVLKSVNPLLDASAIRAVSGWIYKPATLRARAVRVYLTVTVTFNLH